MRVRHPYPYLFLIILSGFLSLGAKRKPVAVSLLEEGKRAFSIMKYDESIHYLELEDGHHDVYTWGRAFPEFLKWGWGKK